MKTTSKALPKMQYRRDDASRTAILSLDETARLKIVGHITETSVPSHPVCMEEKAAEENPVSLLAWLLVGSAVGYFIAGRYLGF